MLIPAASRPLPRPAVTSPLRALRRAPGLLASLFLAASLVACDSGVEPEPRLALMGTVLRSDTGARVPGARVALFRHSAQDAVPGMELVAEATADAQGRYTLSYPAEERECERLTLHATIDSWQNPNISSETSPDLECTSGMQRVDLRLVFSGF